MATQIAMNDGVEILPAYMALDGLQLSPAWRGPATTALNHLLNALEPVDLAILTALRSQQQDVEINQPTYAARANMFDGVSERLPITVALLMWDEVRSELKFSVTCLVAVLVNAALEGPDRSRTKNLMRLAQILRGVISKQNTGLMAFIDSATGMSDLVQSVDSRVGDRREFHLSFANLWNGWLRHQIMRWTLASPEQIRRSIPAADCLEIDVDSPSLPLWGVPQADSDDQLQIDNVPMGSEFAGLQPRSAHSLASAHHLLRQSSDCGLVLPSDHHVPERLISRLAKQSLEHGLSAVAANAPDDAALYLALATLIATGLRESDIGDLCWGTVDTQADLALCIGLPALSVKVRMPPHAAQPSDDLAPYLKNVTNRILWPIPPSLHEALRKTAPLGQPTPGSLVIRVGNGGQGTKVRLHTVITRLIPGAHIGTNRIRLALAAHLSDSFGPEVAQLAMRDSFSTSVGPAYYCSVVESTLTSFVASVLSRWFDEAIPDTGADSGYVGSKIALQDASAREWPRMLHKSVYSAARKSDAWRELLTAKRNHLACALAAVTGHRPVRALGELVLDSVIPEYGLVVLHDKQADLLRRTRVAATGSRWVASLRGYLTDLVELSRSDNERVANWALAVIRSELPLFSLPSDHDPAELFELHAMRATMPSFLQTVSNHYRHRLNHCLMEQGVDWELRHAQLGWVVSPAYAFSDLSPLSPRLFAERIGPILDDVLAADGWFSSGQRVPKWTWGGVPDRPVRDWEQALREYEKEHQGYTRAVHAELKQRRKDAEDNVLPRLADAVAMYTPGLRVDVATRAINATERTPVLLTVEHYALLRDVSSMDADGKGTALETVVAEYLIHDLVVKAIKEGVVSGPEPSRRHMGLTAKLSPFMPGIGLAVRHAGAVGERLDVITASNRTRDLAGLAQLTVLTNTPYRDFNAATRVAAAAAKSIRACQSPEWLRLPTREDRKEVAIVVGGVDAAILGQRGQHAPTVKPLSEKMFGQWVTAQLSGVLQLPVAPESAFAQVVGTLRMAGRIELSGPERLVMDGCPLATVSTERSIAWSDDWPLRTGDPATPSAEVEPPIKDASPQASSKGSKDNRKSYLKLTAALNPTTPVVGGSQNSDGKRGTRQQLERSLDRLINEVGDRSNLGLITAYVRHRLRHGGKSRKKLSQGNLHKETTRYAGVLLDLLGRRSMLALDHEQLQAVYLAVLHRKPPFVRADALEEIVRFHRYMEAVHHAPEVAFGSLRTYAGPRVRSSDAGVLTASEKRRIHDELSEDLSREQARVDASPDAVRSCELRKLMYVVLAGSGIRPGSAHGLVLGDLLLLGPGDDYVHVHKTGEYGRAKTETSVGFVHLEGEVWDLARPWVLQWLTREKKLLGADYWKHPVFADILGSRKRLGLRHLTQRIDVLCKWASGQPAARTYWLRKCRVTDRISAVIDRAEPRARDVHAALRESGHADVVTPLMHYIHDPTIAVRTYLRHASRPNRAAVLAATGIQASRLDQRWHRNRKTSADSFYGTAYDLIDIPMARRPEEYVTTPPVMYRQSPITPAHIDAYARAMDRYGDPREAMAHAGLSDIQAKKLDEGARKMLVLRGCAPWRLDGVRQNTAVMQPGRRLKGTESLFALMEQPCKDIFVLAETWVQQGYLHRLYGADVIAELDSELECSSARWLMTQSEASLILVKTEEGKTLLQAPVPSDGSKSHGDAVRWILAMYWLYHILTVTTPSKFNQS